MNSISTREQKLLRRVRLLTALFILGLVLSGVTAIPLAQEVRWLREHIVGPGPHSMALMVAIDQWLARIHEALRDTQARHPMLFYGTDWLAFGHFAIALAFLGAWRDPVRNRWLFDFGLLACALVIPYALVFGGLRGFPLWWRLIDCSFGVFGAVPLWICRQKARALEDLLDGSRRASLERA